MSLNKPKSAKLSALSFAVAGLIFSAGAQAGMITDSNAVTFTEKTPATATKPAKVGLVGTCGSATNNSTACVGAWNLDNVAVNLVHLNADGTQTPFGTFDKTTGAYSTMALGDSFVSNILGGTASSIMAKLTGKVWPIGEPTGIKAVNDDMGVKAGGKPRNCLINTAYLGVGNTLTPSDAAAYLDSAAPEQVTCSSAFQTHKRFKVAMQPATVDGIVSGPGNPIDLVFNVTNDSSVRDYQVFSKINNYTGKRLSGYKIQVGTGKGGAFKLATDPTALADVTLSLGAELNADGKPIFDQNGLATFSHGLFGPKDELKNPDSNKEIHFPRDGFFSKVAAAIPVAQPATDTVASNGVVSSNYKTLFGEWLPSIWQPKGIFLDEDSNPATDNDIQAWWDGKDWRFGQEFGSAVVPLATLTAWKADPRYVVDDIEDVLNLGIDYIVKVGDLPDLDGDGLSNFTIRIIPVVADANAAGNGLPLWMTSTVVPPVFTFDPPAPVPPAAVVGDGGGGGCTVASGDAPRDPMLPILAAIGLMGVALRRRLRRD